MRYIDIDGYVIPKNCIYGPRPAEGVVFNNYEWWRITDHLVREERDREMAAVCKAKEEAKKDLSFGMTRNWNNTLASIKTQGNQKRQEKMMKEKQDKIDEYNRILKTRMEEKREILENVRKILFNERDAVKTINSAVGYATVLEGRRKQIEMSKALQLARAKEDEEWVAKIKKDEEEFEREKLQEKLNEKAKWDILKKQLAAQLEEIRKARQAEQEEFEMEKQDLINMAKEGQRIHCCNMAEKEHRKRVAARYIKKTPHQLEHERRLILEEEEEDEINRIYQAYNRRFKKERKEREERMKDEAVERRMKISEMLAQKMAEAAQKEEEMNQSAEQEKEEQARREEEEKEEKRRQALQSLLEGKKKAERAKARKQCEEKERQKWEVMQIFRSAEINAEWRENEARRKEEQNKKLVAALDCQVKELQKRRAEELKELEEPLEDEALEKEQLLRYCDDAMKYVKEHNLPEKPVVTAIADIKKLYGYVDKEDLAKKQKESERQECKKSMPLGCYCLKY